MPEGSFDTDAPRGVLGRTMDTLTALRNTYKQRLKASDNPDEVRKWDAAQYATKSLVASLYGVTGDSRYPMYHPAIAAAVTGESRKTLGRLRRLCEERGHRVIYGHTDSVFVEVDSPEEGELLVSWLNEEMTPIVTEFEKFCERVLLKAKYRYAGKVVWSDGLQREPSYYVKGIEHIQARMPKVMKQAMGEAVNSILDGHKEDVVTEMLVTFVSDVVNGNVSPENLMMKGSLKRNLEDYTTIGGSAAGAQWANRVLGKTYKKGDYFWCLIDSTGGYIAFDSVDEIEGKADIGLREMASRFIVKKLEPFYEITNWDLQPIFNALDGKEAYEWL